ncbi:MAG: hypothetical protein ABI697_05715 [Devosia sp.]
MIASFTNNFIFLKSAKTGSSSTEVVLAASCRDPDIVTPNEQTKRGMNDRNWLGLSRFRSHEHARSARRKLPGLWERAFKFTVERHPYEKVVSQAYYRLPSFPDFELALASVIRRGKFHSRAVYEIDGEVAVDEVIDYANLAPRLAELGAQWGHAMPAAMPRINSAQRKDRRPAVEILTEAQKAEIYEGARVVFDRMGFKP